MYIERVPNRNSRHASRSRRAGREGKTEEVTSLVCRRLMDPEAINIGDYSREIDEIIFRK